MLRGFPLFILLLIAYNLMMLFGNIPGSLDSELFSLTLISGAQFHFSVHDLFVVLGVLVLYLEIFKATGTGISSVLDHTLSTMVFIAFLVEFLTVGKCGTPTFFILGLMSMLDVIAGFTISIVAARRDFGLGGDLR